MRLTFVIVQWFYIPRVTAVLLCPFCYLQCLRFLGTPRLQSGSAIPESAPGGISVTAVPVIGSLT